MRQPDIYSASAIKKWPNSEYVGDKESGYWRPARPMGHNAFSWLWRWKMAWNVLIGKFDALKWD